MTIESIKKEVYYYVGKQIGTREANEIKAIYDSYKGAVSLSDIILDYYNC